MADFWHTWLGLDLNPGHVNSTSTLLACDSRRCPSYKQMNVSRISATVANMFCNWKSCIAKPRNHLFVANPLTLHGGNFQTSNPHTSKSGCKEHLTATVEPGCTECSKTSNLSCDIYYNLIVHTDGTIHHVNEWFSLQIRIGQLIKVSPVMSYDFSNFD
jgi:hypothetical protein